MKGLVSIIMPFKNTAIFLPDCIDSILNQTYSNWELIAVNDHSGDSSYNVVKKYTEKDQRIKVLNNEGVGIIRALRSGYAISSGEMITRMDSDDLMVESKLQSMVSDLEQRGPGHIALGLVNYFADGGVGEGYKNYEQWLNKLSSEGDNFDDIYKECVIASPCWMVRRKDFDKSGGFNSDIYPEDYDLTFRFYESGLSCIPSQKLLHMWRDYPSRTSRTHIHYANNTFIELKLHYFLKLHYNKQRPLVIWGAGGKGKYVAKILKEREIVFSWICDNPKKVGKSIYDERMRPIDFYDDLVDPQSVITVANSNSQKQIREFMGQRNCSSMLDYFFFC